MTEVEWLAATDPRPLLTVLDSRLSNRKTQLFAVACCRRIAATHTDACAARDRLTFFEPLALAELVEAVVSGLQPRAEAQGVALSTDGPRDLRLSADRHLLTRAFENQIYYVFANFVGPQGNNLWSAGDSKIVAPDTRILAQADNHRETVIHARIDPSRAARKYATDALQHPAFLSPHWKSILAASKRQLK